jgi:dolichol-phosphate mannosyltransferase
MLRLIKNIIDYFHSIKIYFFKFSFVGLSGIIVNEGLLALLTEMFSMEIKWAGIIAIESSIISNFLLNYYWTWRDKLKKPFLVCCFNYHSIAFISGSINYLILIGLSAIGLNHLIANLVGIAIGTLINFLFSHHWTFKSI